jgi:hypothetical protein
MPHFDLRFPLIQLGVDKWRSITSAPKDGREVIVHRTLAGQTAHEGAAIWRAATADNAAGWIDPESGDPVPEPTHWKAFGRGHPE